jgi:hypothetical protein
MARKRAISKRDFQFEFHLKFKNVCMLRWDLEWPKERGRKNLGRKLGFLAFGQIYKWPNAPMAESRASGLKRAREWR